MLNGVPTNTFSLVGSMPTIDVYYYGHFATNEQVFFYTSDYFHNKQGLIYELPYSERGFLPTAVSSVAVKPSPEIGGNIGRYVDGTYVYGISFVPYNDYLSRWEY